MQIRMVWRLGKVSNVLFIGVICIMSTVPKQIRMVWRLCKVSNVFFIGVICIMSTVSS